MCSTSAKHNLAGSIKASQHFLEHADSFQLTGSGNQTFDLMKVLFYKVLSFETYRLVEWQTILPSTINFVPGL